MRRSIADDVHALNVTRGPIIVSQCDAVRRALLAEWFRNVGIQTYESSGATELITMVHALAPSAIVLDIVFDGDNLDGLTVARYLHDRKINIPFVVLSTDVSIASTVEFMRLGAADVLKAPTVPSRVLYGFYREPDTSIPVREDDQTLAEFRYEYFWKCRVSMRSTSNRAVARAIGLKQATALRVLRYED